MNLTSQPELQTDPGLYFIKLLKVIFENYMKDKSKKFSLCLLLLPFITFLMASEKSWLRVDSSWWQYKNKGEDFLWDMFLVKVLLSWSSMSNSEQGSFSLLYTFDSNVWEDVAPLLIHICLHLRGLNNKNKSLFIITLHAFYCQNFFDVVLNSLNIDLLWCSQ